MTALFSTHKSKFVDSFRAHNDTHPDPLVATLGKPEPAPPPRGLFNRAKELIREYGVYAIALYVGMWIGPLAGVYELCVLNDNFGYNSPAPILTSLGVKDYIYDHLGLAPDARPEPWQVSAAFGYLATEIFEPVRFPLTLFLAPRLKRWFQAARKGESS